MSNLGGIPLTDVSVSFQGVTKKYLQKVAIHEMNFELPTGKMIGLIGPNGSGKSTMLKLMAGLILPSSGTIAVAGQPVNRRISNLVSFASDKDDLYGFYTVSEMIQFYQGIFPDFNAARAKEMMAFMQLDPGVKVKTLSKGNAGRLKMLLALSRTAPVVLMDEPLSGLDPMVRTAIVKSLISFIDLDQQTVILSTHEVLEVEPLLDMVVLVHQGRVRAISRVDEIQEQAHQGLVPWMAQQLSVGVTP